jgi:SAM-dependent methyltransferase
VPIYYRRCDRCHLLFTDAFDDWTVEQFKTHVYNEEYELVDPEYSGARPRESAGAVARIWGPVKSEIRVLDFGGGNGTFCAVLREAGFAAAVTYDPLVPEYAERPEGKFDVVISFEVFEHLPDPLAGIRSIVELAADPGLVFFSTGLQPADLDHRLHWWYVAPRNGHISLFSRQALATAWARYGYKVAHLNDFFHFAFRNLPSYLGRLQPPLEFSFAQSCAA